MTDKISNLDKFYAWAATVYNGRLNKAEIAQQAGFSYKNWRMLSSYIRLKGHSFIRLSWL